MAADARKMREDAAGNAKRKLDEASDAGIRNRKWYEEVGDWFTDNWDTIVAVCKVVVAVDEMDKLNGKIFDGPSDELASFMKHHRSGGAMHNYELVEGPMLRNPGSFVRGKADPVFSGHQVAIYSDRAAELFNNSFHQRFGPAS